MRDFIEDTLQLGYEQPAKVPLLAALDSFDVGQRIRQSRIAKGLKQKELIEDQFSKSYISSIEAGRLLPSPRAFEFFSERLGVSITYLQWGTDNPSEDLTLNGEEPSRASIEPHRSLGLRKRLNWELILTMAQLELERGQPKLTLDQLLEQGTPVPEVNPSLATRYYFILGNAYLNLSDPKAALIEFRRGYEMAQAIPDPELMARFLNAMAQGYFKQGDYSEAITYYRQTLAIIKRSEVKDPSFEAKVYYNLAGSLALLNETTQAMSLYSEAVALVCQLHDREKMANTYRELSLAHHRANNLTLAKDYAERSLSLYEELNNLRLAITVQGNFAQILIKRQEYREAEPYLKNSLELALDLKDHSAAAIAAANLSLIYMHLKDSSQEEEYALQGVEQAGKGENQIALGQALARLANMYAARNNLEEADRYFAQAVTILEPLKANQVLSGIYFEYGRTLMNLQRDREAAALFEKAYILQSGYGPRRA